MVEVDGVDPNVNISGKSSPWTALHLAAKRGDGAAVKLMLSVANTQVDGTTDLPCWRAGYKPHYSSRFRKSPLYLAVKNSHEEVVKLLPIRQPKNQLQIWGCIMRHMGATV